MSEHIFTMEPVGYIRSREDGFCLELDEKYAPALKELDGFSHINVLWWCHLWDEYREIVEAPKPYTNGPEMVGIFATRSPVRPNPIALTTVAVTNIDHERGVIHLPYIDADNGSPVLDIKPYYPSEDRVKNVTVPTWCAHWPQWYEESADFDWAAEFENAQ